MDDGLGVFVNTTRTSFEGREAGARVSHGIMTRVGTTHRAWVGLVQRVRQGDSSALTTALTADAEGLCEELVARLVAHSVDVLHRGSCATCSIGRTRGATAPCAGGNRLHPVSETVAGRSGYNELSCERPARV